MPNSRLKKLSNEIGALRKQVDEINMSHEHQVARPTVVYLAARMAAISGMIYDELDALWIEVSKIRSDALIREIEEGG